MTYAKCACKQKIIAACYSPNALHCFIGYVAILLSLANGDKSVLYLGLLLAIMVPLTFFDNRTKMTGTIVVMVAIGLHTIMDCFIVLLSAFSLLLILSILETILMIIIYLKPHKTGKK